MTLTPFVRRVDTWSLNVYQDWQSTPPTYSFCLAIFVLIDLSFVVSLTPPHLAFCLNQFAMKDLDQFKQSQRSNAVETIIMAEMKLKVKKNSIAIIRWIASYSSRRFGCGWNGKFLTAPSLQCCAMAMLWFTPYACWILNIGYSQRDYKLNNSEICTKPWCFYQGTFYNLR